MKQGNIALILFLFVFNSVFIEWFKSELVFGVVEKGRFDVTKFDMVGYLLHCYFGVGNRLFERTVGNSDSFVAEVE